MKNVLLLIFLIFSFFLPASSLFSEKLKIVIDPGHGGSNEGALYGDLVEKDLTLYVAEKLKSFLDSDDEISAEFIRLSDKYVSIKDRIEIINETSPDYFISIHFNSQPFLTSNRGFEIYYPADTFTDDTKTSFQSYHRSNLSFIIGRSFKNTFLKTPIYQTWGLYLNMFVQKDRLPILLDTEPPGILLELAYITSPEDRACIENPDFMLSMSRYIYRAIKNSMNHIKRGEK